jgi:hypothetical protein
MTAFLVILNLTMLPDVLVSVPPLDVLVIIDERIAWAVCIGQVLEPVLIRHDVNIIFEVPHSVAG